MPKTYGSALIGIALLLCFTGVAQSVRSIYLSVPPYRPAGSTVEMSCQYDLEGDRILTIKWIKDEMEFFRYQPSERRQYRITPVGGVELDPNFEQTMGGTIWLRDVSFLSTGNYTCQVTAERFSGYVTVEDTSPLTVISLSKRPPVITGLNNMYTLSDIVRVHCTSHRSFPEAQLTWLINGDRVEGRLVGPQTRERHSDGTISSTSILRVTATRRRFPDGVMRLKCVASVGQYFKDVEVESYLLGSQAQQMNNMPNSADVRSPFSLCLTIKLLPLTVLYLRTYVH